MFIVVVIVPFLTGVYYSFVSWDGLPKNPMKFVGFANYAKAFQDTRFLSSLERTTVFTLITMVTVNVLALGFALVVTSKLRLRNVGRVMIFMPYLIGGLLLGYIWQFILGDCMATLGAVSYTHLIFGALVLAMYVILILRGVSIASAARSSFHALLALSLIHI